MGYPLRMLLSLHRHPQVESATRRWTPHTQEDTQKVPVALRGTFHLPSPWGTRALSTYAPTTPSISTVSGARGLAITRIPTHGFSCAACVAAGTRRASVLRNTRPNKTFTKNAQLLRAPPHPESAVSSSPPAVKLWPGTAGAVSQRPAVSYRYSCTTRDLHIARADRSFGPSTTVDAG